MDLVCSHSINQLLLSYGIYIGDVNFTQDFKGVFNKEQLIEHLISEHRFRLRNRRVKEENQDHTMLENDNSIVGNCLSYIESGLFGSVRSKCNNKFVQSLESPSVRGAIKNHISSI